MRGRGKERRQEKMGEEKRKTDGGKMRDGDALDSPSWEKKEGDRKSERGQKERKEGAE